MVTINSSWSNPLNTASMGKTSPAVERVDCERSASLARGPDTSNENESTLPRNKLSKVSVTLRAVVLIPKSLKASRPLRAKIMRSPIRSSHQKFSARILQLTVWGSEDFTTFPPASTTPITGKTFIGRPGTNLSGSTTTSSPTVRTPAVTIRSRLDSTGSNE